MFSRTKRLFSMFFFCQECVKMRAVKSMLCVRNISKEEAEKVVESVFDACFHDTEPFERIPPWKKDCVDYDATEHHINREGIMLPDHINFML